MKPITSFSEKPNRMPSSLPTLVSCAKKSSRETTTVLFSESTSCMHPSSAWSNKEGMFIMRSCRLSPILVARSLESAVPSVLPRACSSLAIVLNCWIISAPCLFAAT